MDAAPYRHIAVCVDTSPAATDAVAEGVRLRELGPGRLTLVHVAVPPAHGYSRWEPPQDQGFVQDAREWLNGTLRTVPGADGVVLWGRPAHRVVEWATRSGCDLLVAATHGGWWERAGLGGFSRHIAHAAPCPVLLVPPKGTGIAGP